jgi:hypothetical protein
VPVPALERPALEIPEPDVLTCGRDVTAGPAAQPGHPQQSDSGHRGHVGHPQGVRGSPRVAPLPEQHQLRGLVAGTPSTRDASGAHAYRRCQRPAGARGRPGLVGPLRHRAQPLGRCKYLMGRQRAGAVTGQRGITNGEPSGSADPGDHRKFGFDEPADGGADMTDVCVQHHRTRRQLPGSQGAQGRRGRALLQRLLTRTLRNLGLTTPRRVLHPGSRQEEPPADRGIEPLRGVPDTEGPLPPEGPQAGIEALIDTYGLLPRLGNRHRVHHPRLRWPEVRQIACQRAPDRRPVPGGTADEMVQALFRGRAAHMCGDVTDGLASRGAQHPPQILFALLPLVPSRERREQHVRQLPHGRLPCLPEPSPSGLWSPPGTLRGPYRRTVAE